MNIAKDEIAPVALIIFNRPEFTRNVLALLKKVQVPRLFVIADGPREGVLTDIDLCEATRNVIKEIDWDCNVSLRFLDRNLGCGHSPAKGLDWVFEHVDSCIVLEDDCLPDESFFYFCTDLLNKYLNDSRIMMISGNNHLLGRVKTSDSYFFSVHTQTHGWATWARAWKLYDFYMSDWPRARSITWLSNKLGSSRYAKKWVKTFDDAYQESNSNPKCSYWDFQWTYICWKNNGLVIIPSVNLVKNIGYGDVGTHISSIDHPLANLPAQSIEFPLIHPVGVMRNYDVDIVLGEIVYGNLPIYKRAIRKLSKYLVKISKQLSTIK